MDQNKSEIEGVTPAQDVPSQEPIDAELTRVKGKNEMEKAMFSLKKTAERIKALGGDPTEIIAPFMGETEKEDEDKPVTVGMLKRMEAENALKNASQLADEIADPKVRDLTKEYLKRVVPSGNAQEDLRLAFAAAMSVKNGQVVEEMTRRVSPVRVAPGGSVPASTEEEFVPTEVEANMMKPPFNLTKEQILASRKKA